MKLTQAKNAVESKPKDLKKEKKRNVSRRFVRRKQKKKPKFLYETYPRNPHRNRKDPTENKQETLVTFRKEK